MKERRTTFDFSEIGGLIRNPEAVPKTETYVSVDQVPADVFHPTTGNVVLPKIAPMSISSPPGGFQTATFNDLFNRESRPIVDELVEFSLDTLCASSYLISCPNLDRRIEDFILFFKLISVGANGAPTVFNIERIKRVITYIYTERMDPYAEYSKASSDLGSKVLIRAMHELFTEGLNSVKFEVENDLVVPVDNKSASQVYVCSEDSIRYKNELEDSRFDYIQSLVNVNHSVSTWKKLIDDVRYDLPENHSGAILSDVPGLSLGQVFPFGSAGRMILAVQALDEIFGTKGAVLVYKDKRNALFDPHHINATEYNRIVPYGSESDSMARCAYTYGFKRCVAAYVEAYVSLKAASAQEKRDYPIHERFLDLVGFQKDVLKQFEADAIERCVLWEFDDAKIADIEAIRDCVKRGIFCLSYINSAFQAKKSGVDFYCFLLDPGSFMVLVVPKKYGRYFNPSIMEDKRIVNERLLYSVYLGNLNYKNVKKLHIALSKLTVYSMLEQYGVVCNTRVLGIVGDSSTPTPLERVLKRAYDYMMLRSKRTWYYAFVPSYGAKLLLDVGDIEPSPDDERIEYSDSSEVSDDGGLDDSQVDIESDDIGNDEPGEGRDNGNGTVESVEIGPDVVVD